MQEYIPTMEESVRSYKSYHLCSENCCPTASLPTVSTEYDAAIGHKLLNSYIKLHISRDGVAACVVKGFITGTILFG